MIEAGRAYVSANKLFVNGIKDLSQQCKKEEMISVSGSDKTSQLEPESGHPLMFQGQLVNKWPLICLWLHIPVIPIPDMSNNSRSTAV